MEMPEPVECPFCFDQMQLQDRKGIVWLFCPNGCPTEMEAPVRKPSSIEESEAKARAAGKMKPHGWICTDKLAADTGRWTTIETPPQSVRSEARYSSIFKIRDAVAQIKQLISQGR